MSKLAEVLNDALNSLGRAKQGVAELGATLKAKEKEREDLVSLARPKAELIELIDERIDESAAAYPERLARALAHDAHHPMDKRHALNHDEGAWSDVKVCTATEHPQVAPTPKTIERALCFLLRDQLKAGVRKAIDEMPYPTRVGPPMTERSKRLAQLDADIASLKAQIKEINDRMREVGVA